MNSPLEAVITDEKGGFYSEWESLFAKPKICAESIRVRCFRGELQGSKLRSLYWRILLQCLPLNRSGWVSEINSARENFSELRKKYICDPRDANVAPDLTLNNPLSLQENSPWQQYFEDQELKASIVQDVQRTFPELEYFQCKEVRSMMVDLLFVYGRVNPHISYKQGYCIESKDCMEIMTFLLKEEFLPHDAFHMFCQVMRILQPWYCAPETPPNQARSFLPVGEEPFARPQDHHPSNALVVKLNRIGDSLLKKIDAPLYKHLDGFEIAPQIYGIRWLRLLFGREFPIQDLLFLWDAIFADGAPFYLVDFIFVAMLVSIRELLLQSDYTGCLHYLMRYPPISDVHSLLALALHLRDSKRFPKPKSHAISNFSHITISGSPHPNKLSNHEIAAVPQTNNRFKTSQKMMQSINKMGNLMADTFKDDTPTPIDPLGVSSSVPSRPPSLAVTQKSSTINKTSSFSSPLRRNNSSKVNKMNEGLSLLQEQISCLQVRVNDVEALSKFAADKLDVCADVIEGELTSCDLSPEREGFRAVSDLRRLGRLLRNGAPNKGNYPDKDIQPGRENSSEDSFKSNSGSRSNIARSPVEIGTDPARNGTDYVYNEMKDMSSNNQL